MAREKFEWAVEDVKSASLKLKGNTAISRGEYKEAFVVYGACMELSPHEPVYYLNCSATGLKLKLFKHAEEDM